MTLRLHQRRVGRLARWVGIADLTADEAHDVQHMRRHAVNRRIAFDRVMAKRAWRDLHSR